MIPSLTITTMSSSSSDQPNETTGSYDITSGSHDVASGSHDAHDTNDRACNIDKYSNEVPIETDDVTIVQERSNLRQCDVEKGVSGSHDEGSSTAEENSHDPDRSVVLDKIYQKYITDRKSIATEKMHGKKKVSLSWALHFNIISYWQIRHSKKLHYKQRAQATSGITHVMCQHTIVHLLSLSGSLMGVAKEEFPFLQLSPSMARRLWQKQLQQVKQLSHPVTNTNPAKKVWYS